MQTSLRYEPLTFYLCRESEGETMTNVTATDPPSEAIRFGDEAAFGQVFREFHAPLCRYALGIVGDPENAEEVVQDVFLRIWEKRETLRITVSLKSYLYRAVHNGCINQIESNKKKVRLDEAPMKIVHQAGQPDPGIQQKELEQAIGRAIGSLPEQCRRVFELSRFEKLKYSEIAGVLGISVKTVENQMGKALRVMRERLAPFLTVLVLSCLFHLSQLLPLS